MDSVITNFMNLGFPEEKVRRALQLTNNDFIKTLDYLTNGIPEPSKPETPSKSQPKQSMTNSDKNTINNEIDDIDDIYGYSDDEQPVNNADIMKENTNIDNNTKSIISDMPVSQPKQSNTNTNTNSSAIDNIDDIYGYSDDDQQDKNTANISNIEECIISYCKCSEQLQRKTTTDAFIYCDGCNELMQKGDIVYTCPKGTDSLQHRSGYDLCECCAKNNKSAPSKSKTEEMKNDTNEINNNGYNNMSIVKSNDNICQYEWEWSSHGGSRWNKYDSNVNDVLNTKLSVGKTMQVKIRGNVYNITKFDEKTAMQKNPITNKTRNIRRVELNSNNEIDNNKNDSALQNIMEILGCNYSDAQYAYNRCNNNQQVAINYLLEKQSGGMNDNNHSQMQQMQQMQQLMQMGGNNMNNANNMNNMQGFGGNNYMNMQQNDNNYVNIFSNDTGNDNKPNIFGNEKDDSDIDDIYGYSDDDNDNDAKQDSVKEESDKGKDLNKNVDVIENAQSEAAKAAINRYNENVNGNNKDDIGDIDDIYGYSDDEQKDKNEVNKKDDVIGDDLDDIYGYSDDEKQKQVMNNDNENKKELNKEEMHNEEEDEIIYFKDDNDNGNVENGKDNYKNIEMVNNKDKNDNGSDIDDIYGYSDDDGNDNNNNKNTPEIIGS